jgi:hypothetical protein
VFDVGGDEALLAPDTGILSLAVNDASGVSGFFQVSVGSGVVPARGLESVAVDGFTQNASVVVPPDGSWHASGVTVHKGDPVVLSATGTLTGQPLGGLPSVDAFGEGAFGGTSFLLSNHPVFALFGRVGTETFLAGTENAILAPSDGELSLAVNAQVGCSTDGGIAPAQCLVNGLFTAAVRAP